MDFLKRLFNNKTSEDSNELDREFERQLENQTDNNTKQTMTPTYNQSHQAFPGLNVEKYYNKINIDLAENGMNESLVRNGNTEHLVNLLSGVRSSYLEELQVLKEAVRNDAIKEMHNCRQQVINNHNKLRHINENLIPESNLEIEEAKEEIGGLKQRSADEFEDLNSGFNTSLISEIKISILTFKKNIRELQSKSIGLESENSQLENQEAQLRANIDAFNPYSRDTLDNKLNTFFRGWLKGLEMIGNTSEFTKQSNEIFSAFLSALDEHNNHRTEVIRKIA